MNEAPLDAEPIRLDSVEEAIAAIAAGEAVVVIDDEDRENEGDLIFAADKATPELVSFMVRYSSGYICTALTLDVLDRLNLPPMIARNEDARGTAYTVTVDANTGTTGISATSRSETIQRLANSDSTPGDFTRPGHVVPLAARPGGVLERDGHTEASVDLARLAGLNPAGVLCEIVSEEDPIDMARSPELRRFADRHNLKMISIEQLIAWRRKNETQITRETITQLPTDHGLFTVVGYRHELDGQEHVALVAGGPESVDKLKKARNVSVRVHSECLTGDVFGSRRCDCGEQLDRSMELLSAGASEGEPGLIIYLRGHEGRGIGLLHKLKAYSLQDKGLDTVDANLEQGLPADAREYSVAGQILRDLGIASANLMTNNPTKGHGLSGYGFELGENIHLSIAPNSDNIAYLRTKRDRMGHNLPELDAWDDEHSKH